jgi:Tfp pilus assembly protein PilX
MSVDDVRFNVMNRTFIPVSQQRGISLVMSLIMLVVLTMIAISATYSTSSSIRIVGNMQMQDEALTAAQAAIDKKLSSLNTFTTPASADIEIDVNRDGATDYTVTVAAPVCMSSKPKSGYSATMASSAPQQTTWDMSATVVNTSTGARVQVNQGVRIDMLPYQGCP